MELVLLKLVGLFRPLASIEYAEIVFDVAAIALFAMLVGAFLVNSATRRAIRLSAIDVTVFAFATWCLATYVIYFESSDIRHVAKLLIPLLSFTVVKNVVRDRLQYRDLLFWILVGFSIPLILSVMLIATGKGVDHVNYWTGIPRWQGAYANSHNMGHSMTLLIMILVLYWIMKHSFGNEQAKFGVAPRLVLLSLGGMALFCLYMSQVRSAILGLIVFGSIYLFFTHKKLLIAGTAGLTLLAVALSPYWLPALLPDVVTLDQGGGEAIDIGSSRPRFWLHNLTVFANLPLDQMLAGVGIGNIAPGLIAERAFDSHNDWMDVLMQTGMIGFVIFVTLQVFIFKAIRRLDGIERSYFIALFFAVCVMMFVSNSYAWRIQVGHLYYIILAFIELRRTPASELGTQPDTGKYGATRVRKIIRTAE